MPGRGSKPGKRGDVEGWTRATTRRNTQFLGAVDVALLDGEGFAFTFTVRDCPESAVHWHSTRRAFIARLHRRGLIRLHWVTEWQRRGVPHLHGCAFFDTEEVSNPKGELLRAWLTVARPFGALAYSQDIAPISDAVGWFQYLTKHLSRGVRHYQRAKASIPPGWQRKTGRVWGHVGEWPLQPPTVFDLDRSGWWAYRRIVRGWRIADARASGKVDRLRAARVMLGGDRKHSEVRGLSEWLSSSWQLAVLAHVAGRGFKVWMVDDEPG